MRIKLAVHVAEVLDRPLLDRTLPDRTLPGRTPLPDRTLPAAALGPAVSIVAMCAQWVSNAANAPTDTAPTKWYATVIRMLTLPTLISVAAAPSLRRALTPNKCKRVPRLS
jgi:hypothetical protein